MDKSAQIKLSSRKLWIKRYGSMLLFILATVLAISASWFASQQKPHQNAFRVSPSWFSSDFWLYPLERNAFKRLPVIESTLVEVFAIDERVWAVGSNGLIIHSPDGGMTWQQQQVIHTEPIGLRSQWNLMGEAWASLDNLDLSNISQTESVAISVADKISQLNNNVVAQQPLETPEANQRLSGKTQISPRVEELQKAKKRFNVDLNSIFFVDIQRGWAVGKYGTILATKDGGNTWQLQDSRTQSWLTSITFSDSNNGWVAGMDGTILSTTDGGTTWRPQASGTKTNLSIITFNDSNNGWVAGGYGTILMTTDGGTTWRPQASGTQANLTMITFNDSNHGWVTSTGGTIFSTIDGGKTWLPTASGTQATLYDITFNDSSRGWAVGEGGTVLATTDGGISWQAQTRGTNGWFKRFTFIDSNSGWAVKLGRYANEIFATTDGGLTWTGSFISDWVEGMLTSIIFVDSNRGWAVGSSGTVSLTTDGGKTWQSQESGTKVWLTSITFVDSNRGWVAGADGTLLVTTDGGANWQSQSSGTKAILTAITFIDNNRGWVAGADGTILVTTDGGVNWQPQSSGTQARLNSIAFIDSNHGSATGREGTVLSTTDGGDTWQEVVNQRYPAPWFYLAILLVLLLYVAAFWERTRQARQENRQQAAQSIANLGVTDKPAGPGQADLVGARQIALGLTRFLTNENTQPPLTIAITGEWGSGKSSVMNYLFANLKREGLRPVWFNAWHHREEQNVLASILKNIHQQAIRPWWHPAGIWFRLRMLWRRHWLWKTALLSAFFCIAFLSTWLVMSEHKRHEIWRYAFYLVKIEQPVVLSERGFRQLCTNWAAINDATEQSRQLGTPRIKPEKPEKPEKTEKTDFFNTQQCEILHTLHSHERIKRDELNCVSRLDQVGTHESCYASPDIFFKTLEERMKITLTANDEEQLTQALDFLRPDLPLPYANAVFNWLVAALAVLFVLGIKSMTLLGFAPMQLMQGILRQSGLVAQTGEKVGTRMLFERHFKLITGLLGKRRLVLFIDDLDRCDKEHTRQVLEMTNFLSSSGELFIVLGMAPRYVLANVTLSYKDLAQAVHEADRLNGNDKVKSGDQEFNPGQSWFAQHYLQKLIHIEVPVPKPENAQIQALLSADGKSVETDNELEKNERREQRVDHVLGVIGRTLRIVLLLGAIGFGIYLGNPEWHKTEAVQVEGPAIEGNNQLLTDTDASKLTTDRETDQQSVEPDVKKSSGPVFKPGVDRFDSSPLWIGLSVIALLVTLGMGLFWIMQRIDKLDNYPSVAWLKPLLHRLKVMLFGPESTRDSQNFVDALRIWHPLIAQKNPTPRTVKAFINRLRYMANRREFSISSGDSANAHREAHLVAVAAIYYCYESDINNVLGNLEVYLADEARPSHNRFEERWSGLAIALGEHFQSFGAYPSKQDFAFYQAMNADICIHRQA